MKIIRTLETLQKCFQNFSVHYAYMFRAVQYTLSHPKILLLIYFHVKTVENLKCNKTVLESGSLDPPVFIILAVVGFGTRERPSSVVQV